MKSENSEGGVDCMTEKQPSSFREAHISCTSLVNCTQLKLMSEEKKIIVIMMRGEDEEESATGDDDVSFEWKAS